MGWQQEDAVMRETRLIPYRFTDEEIADLKSELPEILSKITQEEDEKTLVMRGYNDRLKVLRSNAGGMVRAIRTGVEDREMECFLIPNYLTMSMEFYVAGREEPVWTRPLNAAERQQYITFPREVKHNG